MTDLTKTAVPEPNSEPQRAGVGDGIRGWWDGLSRPAQWAVGIPIVIVLALIPVFPPPLLDTPGVSFGGVMALFSMYALIAIGLNVVVGQAGLLDLGYVGFYAVGAYTVGLLTSPNSPWNQTDNWLEPSWAWVACVPIAVALTAVSGLILGTPTLRVRGDYLAIVTLGFGEIVRLMADNLGDLTNGSLGLSKIAYPEVAVSESKPGGVFSPGNLGDTSSWNPFERANSGTWWFWLGLILVIGALLIIGNLERSRVGRAWVAIREDEDAAEIMGVPTFKFKLWAFVIGASVGGLSGAMYAGQVTYVNPKQFDIILSMLFLCAVVLGGSGNKLGVIVGAFLIAYLPMRLQSVQLVSNESTGYLLLALDLALLLGLWLLWRRRGNTLGVWARRGVIATAIFAVVAGLLLFGSVLLFRVGGAQSLGDLKYLYFGLALVVMMVLRPQGLFPVRQKLLAYGRQVYQAVRKPAELIGANR